MNKNQREELYNAISIVRVIAEAEQEKYDNAPENLQETERVEQYQKNADTLTEAAELLEEVSEGGY